MAPDGWASSQTIPDWLVSWMIYECLVGGFSPPLWKMMEFVSWDDYSQYMEQLNMFQTTNRKIMRNPPSGNLTCRFNHESQLGWWHSQYMESHKIHVPNHQPVMTPVVFLATCEPYQHFLCEQITCAVLYSLAFNHSKNNWFRDSSNLALHQYFWVNTCFTGAINSTPNPQ